MWWWGCLPSDTAYQHFSCGKALFNLGGPQWRRLVSRVHKGKHEKAMRINRLVGRVRLYIKSGNLINTVCVVFTICHYFFAKRSVETPFFAWLVFLLAVYRRLYPLLSPPFDFCSQQCNIIYHHARPDSGHHRPRGPEPGEGGCKVVPSVIFFPHRAIHPSARSDPLPNHLPTMIPPPNIRHYRVNNRRHRSGTWSPSRRRSRPTPDRP